ncbi:MAG: hypothetical protein JWN66_4950 [Sphingomonas bacterium]|nr:hypothetical protein [Sphingomonas bacterium]
MTPATLAEGLSEAQREALLRGRWNAEPYASVFIGRGVVQRVQSKRQPLLNLAITPLGLSVRAYLKEQGK